MKIPIKTNKWVEGVSIIILITSFAFAFYFYANFTDKVVSHWNFRGEPDGYMGRFGGAFAIPIMLAAMYFGLMFLPALDPKRERYADFSKPYNTLRVGLIVVMFVVYLAASLFNLGYNVSINYLVPFSIGTLMMLIGNMLGKIKTNWFVGIRTPWTLSSENVWNKTHHMGGFLFVVFGFIIMIVPLLSPLPGLILFIAGVVGITVGTFAYSYILYRKEKK
jgi:uncharacterized membrane protein